MGFLGVYKAVYDYVPQGESELAIKEGDILYVLEKSGEDDWWKAKKKASGEDDDEPEGLIGVWGRGKGGAFCFYKPSLALVM
jgi:hypothetical protein